MTKSGNVAASQISRIGSADFASVTEPGRALGAILLQTWTWLNRNSRGVLTRRVSRRLRVAETVSLGEKRFVSILQVDGEQFLVGGSSASLVLLAKLEEKPELPRGDSFENVFTRADSGAARSEVDGENSAGATR